MNNMSKSRNFPKNLLTPAFHEPEEEFDDNQEDVSAKIYKRIKEAGVRCHSNDNISEYIKDGEIEELVEEVADKLEDVLHSLIIDTDRDWNTKGTAHRVAKMLVNETCYGHFHPKPKMTLFPNGSSYDQLYITGPISIRGTCAHHFMPIIGKAYIGIYPGKNVIGLSKFNRLIDWIASRPSIQEEMTVQVADAIEKETEAEGVAVIIKAEHLCLTHRGFREHESDMTTSVMRGVFKNNVDIKREFIDLMGQMR